MKTIGLLGGMSWESTALYYREINTYVREALGGLHSAQCLLYSFDFHEIEAYQGAGDWERAGEMLATAAHGLERAGADCIVICTNTMHKVAHAVERRLSIPLLHIADLTAEALTAKGIGKVGLLGTKYTMEQDFYKSRLTARGIEVLIPDAGGVALVNRVIYDELCLGVITASSKEGFLSIIGEMGTRGAQGVILGCTEIGLLIGQEDTSMPLFDTTLIHAQKAGQYALQT